MVSFSDLGIGPAIVRELNKQGITEPFEVQKESIPDSLLGRDVCCRAPTGSGKTLAFGLPLIARTKRANPKRPTGLILTPTRELAEQINSVLRPIALAVDRDVVSIYGGVSYKKQYNALNKGVDILVACPGRLIDLLDRRALKLDDVETVVLDEADRMLDMGFYDDIIKIVNKLPKNRQTLLFSATMPNAIRKLAKSILFQPKEISLAISKPARGIKQSAYLAYDKQKVKLVRELLLQKKNKKSYKKKISARYIVGCDGARSRVRKKLNIPLKGDSSDSRWGVMDALVQTNFPDIRVKCFIKTKGHGSALVIPREGGYLVRLYIELDLSLIHISEPTRPY